MPLHQPIWFLKRGGFEPVFLAMVPQRLVLFDGYELNFHLYSVVAKFSSKELTAV